MQIQYVKKASPKEINRQIYCSAKGSGCDNQGWQGEWAGAIDWANTDRHNFNVSMWYAPRNRTNQDRRPEFEPYQRSPELLNRAANSWLATYHGEAPVARHSPY